MLWAIEQFDGTLYKQTGLAHVVQAVRDVEVLIDVFIKSIEEDKF